MKRTLYIQDAGVYLYDNKRQSEDNGLFFEWAQLDELKQRLTDIEKTEPLFLILDVVDEDLISEWKPKLFPWEKKDYLKLEEQKVSREGALFSHLEWTGITRKTNYQTKEELFLKSIVYKNDHIQALLDLIESLELRLDGIYSISYLIDVWFKKQLRSKTNLSRSQLQSPFFLLVRLSKKRFRQLFYLNGLLRISRDFKVDSQLETEQAIQSAVMYESSAALKYLYNQKIVPYNTPVSMILVDIYLNNQEKWLLFFKEHYLNKVWSETDWFFRKLDFSLVNKKIKEYTEDQTGQWVLAQFALNTSLPTYYSNEYVQQVIKARRLTHSLYGSLAGLAAFILFYGAYQGSTLYFLHQKTVLYQQQIIAYQKAKAQLQNQVHLIYDAKDLKTTVEFSKAFLQLKKHQNAGIDWLPMMQVLDKSEHIQLKAVDWRVKGKIDSDLFEVKLSGWVFPFKGQYTLPTQWVDQFVQSLKALPNMVDVKLVKEPLNRDLKHSLTVISIKDGEVQALPFEIMLQVKR